MSESVSRNKERIIVVFVINYITNNGPGMVVKNLIDSLDRSETAPGLATIMSHRNDQTVVRKFKEAGIPVIECGYRNQMDLMSGWRGFQKTLMAAGADIIHSHGLLADIAAASLPGNVLKVSTVHSNLPEDYQNAYGAAGKLLLAPLHIRYLNRLDLCICCSSSVQHALKNKLRRSVFVRNGIELPENADLQGKGQSERSKEEEMINKRLAGIPRDAKLFLFAGKLIRRKNVEWLIRAFVSCRHKDEYLIIAGDGECMDACRNAADEHVIFTGFVRKVERLYEIADIYVSASLSEGFSISVIEALSHGMGMLLSDIPSHTELFEIRQEVYIGELFGAKTFKEGLYRLRENWSRLDRETIRGVQQKHLSSRNMADSYLSIYRRLYKKHKRDQRHRRQE